MKNWRLPKNARTFVLAITSNELHIVGRRYNYYLTSKEVYIFSSKALALFFISHLL